MISVEIIDWDGNLIDPSIEDRYLTILAPGGRHPGPGVVGRGLEPVRDHHRVLGRDVITTSTDSPGSTTSTSSTGTPPTGPTHPGA